MVSSVADPERMDADLDLTFYIDADPHFNLLVTYFLKHLNIGEDLKNGKALLLKNT